jgi:calcineurin-like phosphoesterase family protein
MLTKLPGEQQRHESGQVTQQHRHVQVWYTADPHIGHRLIAGLHGFTNPDDHDAELARRWDKTVGTDDTVWVLGDISAGGRAGQRRALDWIAQRVGVKHLIAGNHDGVHPMHVDAHKMLPRYLTVFASVQQSARRTLAGQTVLLSHFPYLGVAACVESDHRFDQWRMPDKGSWLLHGHTHEATQVRNRSIQVGLDAWDLTLVSIDTIARIVQTASPSR